jgi:pSer/pThr/pTyr-binding forkhead associated (FHA) protein
LVAAGKDAAMDEQRTLTQCVAPFQPLRLRIHPGGQVMELTAPDLVLGRHSQADLRLPLPEVSRRHCRFVHSAGGWELIDLDSLNGVYVNGMRVERALLHTGDSVRVGNVELEVDPACGTEPVMPIRNVADAFGAETRKAS